MGQQDQERNKKIYWTNENEDKTIQKLWDTGKAILRGKFIALESYIKKIRKKRKRWDKQSNFTLKRT